ncbi:hypothetical protein [Blastomonas aquatica]|uniref:Uncharacterized protein n=2 Tax=Blastomonas aquatica TaxID=1510276 RepID=A0ABQ1JS60_9SPHN|nr:hypothetical protein GCM10010833_33370 [Blastomonas aquatica]
MLADGITEVPDTEVRYSVHRISWFATAWGLLVIAVLVWQSYSYTGVFAWLAEWQFRRFDRMFPVVTIFLLTLLLILPALLLIGWRLRERRRLYGRANLGLLTRRGTFLGKWLAILSGLFFIVSVGLALFGLSVSSGDDQPVRSFSLTNPAPAAGREVQARAWVRTDRIGYYRERLIFTERDLYVAPLTVGENPSDIQVFIQVSPTKDAVAAKRRVIKGFLREAAIPGALERLYQDAGYRIKRPTYLVFQAGTSARWPFLSAAADLALIALLLGLGALLTRRHVRMLGSTPDQK